MVNLLYHPQLPLQNILLEDESTHIYPRMINLYQRNYQPKVKFIQDFTKHYIYRFLALLEKYLSIVKAVYYIAL